MSFVSRPAPAEFKFPKKLKVHPIQTIAAAEKARDRILRDVGDGYLAIDEESAEIDGEWRTLCVGFCAVPWEAWVFVLDHPENACKPKVRRAIAACIKDLLQSDVPKTMHHGTYDNNRFVREFGVEAHRYDWDTHYSAYMDEPTGRRFSLEALADRRYEKFAGYKAMIMPEGRDQLGYAHFDRVPLARLCQYNAIDCHLTLMLQRDSDAPAPLVRIYTEAAHSIELMQGYGPRLDRKQAERAGRLYPAKQEKLKRRIQKLAGNPDLNPNSPKQLKDAIYGTWGLRRIEGDTTNKEVLKILMQRSPHDGVKAIQDYREAKNRAERVAAFRRSAEAHDGCVRTFWWLTGTRTGRLSSGGGQKSDKRALGNLQNIPSDTTIKNMLISDNAWRQFAARVQREGVEEAIQAYPDIEVFVARDYSQMELRVMAQVSNEKAMIKQFNAGKDIHAAIGSLWSNWSFEKIQTDSKVRRIVKALHFGIIYGLGGSGLRAMLLAQGVKLPLKTVEGYIHSYWRSFPAIARYRDEQVAIAQSKGYVTNLFGFRVPIDHSSGKSGAWWKNQAVNAPIQGGAHQVMLCAFALLHRHPDGYPNVRPQMEVHDSLVCRIPLYLLRDAIEETRFLLEKDARKVAKREFGIKWKVPLVTDCQIGFRYGALADVDETLALEGAIPAALESAIEMSRQQDKDLKRELKSV